MNKVAKTLKQASQRLREQKDTIEEQSEELATFRRERLAEEIAEMKVASGGLAPSELLHERDRLVESDKDLEQTKIAMQEVGPGLVDQSVVDVGDESEPKEASTSDARPERDHVRAAQSELSQTLQDMGIPTA